MNIRLRYILVCVTLSVLGKEVFPQLTSTSIKHQVEVIHPGISPTEAVDATLVEIQDKSGKPVSFSMEVESVVCGDSQCRIDVVKIHWDQLARFKRLELPDGVSLEKAEGQEFTKADYLKLDSVLKDEDSPLKHLQIDQLVGSIGSEGVDAVSRASVSINKADYVEGAIWTCYSLWYWAHGEAKEIIRSLTGDAHTTLELQAKLHTKDPAFQRFAIEQLIERKDFSKRSVEFMLAAVEKNPTLLKPSLAYWEIIPNGLYVQVFKYLLAIPGIENRLLCLNSLAKSRQSLFIDFFHELPLTPSTFSYQELHVYINVLEKYKAGSPEIIQKLIPLLASENFLIARRVYWFLNEQDVTDSQQNQLKKFYRTWQHKL